jgi:hypothetical protein
MNATTNQAKSEKEVFSMGGVGCMTTQDISNFTGKGVSSCLKYRAEFRAFYGLNPNAHIFFNEFSYWFRCVRKA